MSDADNSSTTSHSNSLSFIKHADNSRTGLLVSDVDNSPTIQRTNSLSFMNDASSRTNSLSSMTRTNSLSFMKNESEAAPSKDLSNSSTTLANLSCYISDLEPVDEGNSFQKFVHISVDDCDFSVDNVKHWGNSHLSPLALKSASVSYQFPTYDHNRKEKELFPCCYPHGLEIRIIPRYLSEQAKQLGWMGSKADKYQLHEVSLKTCTTIELSTYFDGS